MNNTYISLRFSAILFTFLFSVSLSAQFITKWETTTDGESITIPTFSGETYDYTVNWGDGNTSTGQTGDATHTYANAGTYTVSITGTFPRIYFNYAGDRAKILEVTQWGTNAWTSMGYAFFGCSQLTLTATDAPNLTNVTDMSYMFSSTASFTGDLSGWDVSNVTNMQSMFYEASSFNGDLSAWDVSNVTDMSDMFSWTSSFTSNLSTWDVSNVTNMSYMFAWASSFNGDISGWNVSNVTDMSDMFSGAGTFNGDISGWDVSSVTNMSYMFSWASSFTSNLSTWDVSSVTTMGYMFSWASSFNGNLSGWDVSNVTNMSAMLEGVTLSTANYDALLDSWGKQNVQSNLSFHGGYSKYCDLGETGKSTLEAKGWTINDGGKDTAANCGTLNLSEPSAMPWAIAPNPTAAVLHISGSTPVRRVQVYSIDGKKQLEQAGSQHISLEHLEQGVYLLKLEGAKETHTFKVIKL